jgi:hypothetical protein
MLTITNVLTQGSRKYDPQAKSWLEINFIILSQLSNTKILYVYIGRLYSTVHPYCTTHTGT